MIENSDTFDLIPDFLDIKKLCEVLGIGRTKAYEIISNQEIQVIRVGRNIRIPKPCFLDYISKKCDNALHSNGEVALSRKELV